MVGQTVSHYEIVDKLGEGGMGVVYKARDCRLDRFVALKFLRDDLGPDSEEWARFLNEARAASALDHPNICAVYDVGTAPDGRMFLVMPFYAGQTLRALMTRAPVPLAQAIAITSQLADGLAAAHARGIVHRDIKPSNIIVTEQGAVKVLDFGVAKLADATRLTQTGTTIGTIGYMAPEQVQGSEVDPRADVWAIGVTLYELLAGRPAFPGTNAATILQSVLSPQPVRLDHLPADTPPFVTSIIARAVEKNAAARYEHAGAMAEALRDAAARTATGVADGVKGVRGVDRASRGTRIAVVAVAVVAVLATTAWYSWRDARIRRARNEGLPRLTTLVNEGKFGEAFALFERIEPHLAGDPALEPLKDEFLRTMTIESDPPGAQVEVRDYALAEAAWRPLGQAPLAIVRMPAGGYRWRFSAPGRRTVERSGVAENGTLRVSLPAEGDLPAAMVDVPGGSGVIMLAGLGVPRDISLKSFAIDRYEVTNREFARFVSEGGYRHQEFWREPFVDNGGTLSWADATARFVDSTGQPGPAAWEAGGFPADEADLPVRGVSWYEASAYAAWAGRHLPTVFHWYRAAGVNNSTLLLPLANFGQRRPIKVGVSQAIGPYGSFDMAGNVREWCVNRAGSLRYALGGAWTDPPYLFGEPDVRPPMDRAVTNGFRTVKYSGASGPDAGTDREFSALRRDFRAATVVSDETFAAFRRLHAYERRELDARPERTVTHDWGARTERVTVTTAYDDRRLPIYVATPVGGRPPYQAIVVFPGAEARLVDTSASLEQPGVFDFLVRSGRMVVQPVYRGMYERQAPFPAPGVARRDFHLKWSMDVQRTVDYLASRPDVDTTKIAYLGLSLGAWFGPIALSVERRFSLGVLLGGGFPRFEMEPEIESIHYAPRVTVPTLMVNGRYDFFYPFESSQQPLFERIGTPPDRKRHVAVDAAHSVPRRDVVREVLAWLDAQFGPAR